MNEMLERYEKYFILEKMRKNYVTCCPYHREETGSLIINFEKDEVFCFGCGLRDNVKNFIENYEKGILAREVVAK